MSITSAIPDPTDPVKNLDESPHLALDGYSIAEWGPERDGKGKPTQVHLVLEVKELGVSFVIRFKSADAVDRHIAALLRHRSNVFGAEGG